MISFNRSICSNFDSAVEKEWLETNGIGGYASSTIVGVNTRGYHGLLIAATRPPLGRMLLLSKIEETVVVGDRRYEISCNQYPGVIHPEGYRYLDSFRLDPFPIFTYAVADVVVEKSVFMVHGENTTFVTYKTIRSPGAVTLELRPLIACRDFHGRMHERNDLNMDIRWENGSISIAPHEVRLFMSVRLEQAGRPFEAEFQTSGCWYRNFEYRMEAYRGQESHEDLYSPGCFICTLTQGNKAALVASTDDPSVLDVEDSCLRELRRRNSILFEANPNVGAGDQHLNDLMMAADQFLVRRGDGDLFSIIAGYHWFGDWGRDTMIALPGLALIPGRYDIARGILKAFARYCDRGIIPNRLPEAAKQPDYNTVDASLWFVYAVKKYLDYTSDLGFIQSELFHVLTQIIQHYMSGTRYNIHMDTDGLIYAGEAGTQLTWMDAKVGDLVVTPRRGKAVEINALWHNALRTMERISLKLGEGEWSAKCSYLAEKTKRSFNRTFWNEAESCLYDCVDGYCLDASIRPNQIFAISLPYRLLTEERAKAVLKVVQRELLTPLGLRSLSPKHKQYIGHYGGDGCSRDVAYHQGTVWAWLLGPFITAYINVNGQSKEAKQFAEELLSEFLSKHLKDAGLGTISEIFDGDPPHHPRGCIAQAWSVAEILRAYVEDVRGDSALMNYVSQFDAQLLF
jgi:predicted glycogen debranching enzyme